MTGVFVSSEVLYCGEDGDMEYGQEVNDGGEVDRYQCLDCGWIVPEVKSADELWLHLSKSKEGEEI